MENGDSKKKNRTDLGDGVERPADVEDALGVAWDALGDHDACA